MNNMFNAGVDDDFADITVQLLDCTTGAILFTDVTNFQGEYEFTGLSDGCYDLKFVIPDGYCVVPDSGDKSGEYTFNLAGDTQTIRNICFAQVSSVSGFAWRDAQGDGVFSGESGLGNVIVTLSGTDGFGDAISVSTSTDKTGAYSFEDLCAGDYALSFATPAGFFITSQNVSGTDTSNDSDIAPDATGANGTVASFPLAPNATADNINGGFVRCNLSFIQGEFAFCNADLAFTETYQIETHGLGTYEWFLDGTPIAGATSNVVDINFPAGPGVYTISFDYSLGGTVVCEQEFEVGIVDPPASNVLACNNAVNLSLNTDCMLLVQPDMLLEGSIANDAGYTVELQDVEGDSILPSNMAGFEYAGKTLIGKVTHICTGNSCWGSINVEDKNIPKINCVVKDVNCGDDISPTLPGVTTFNFNAAGTTDEAEIFNSLVNWPITGSGCGTVLNNNCYTIETIGLCGPSTLCYEDVVGALDCEQPDFSQIVSRIWTITTPSGTTNTCTDEIRFLKPDLDALDFPPHATGDDALDCRFGVTTLDSILDARYFLLLPNGNPDPASPNHDLSVGGLDSQCDRLKTTYTDQRFGDCDGAYKLQRTWIVLDWCTSEIRDSVQIIEVAQRGNIVCVAPPEFEVPATTNCSDAFDVPPPIIVFPGCSAITNIRVGYKVAEDAGGCEDRAFTFTGVTRNADGTYRIPNVDRPTNMIWIGYVIENECGQTCTSCTEVTFVDAEEPVAVCDQHTVVSLNDQGMAWASPEAFDDGSWDNCGLDRLEVMKLTGSDCGEPREFASKIKFCCEDIGQEVQILVKVIDNVGLENTCKSTVEVQDNFTPTLLSCPSDVNVNCDIDPMDLSSYGSPSFDGVCDVNIKADTTININDCGIGTIVRRWNGVNSKGNSATCTQTINVGRLNPFDENDITWPENFDGEGCYESSNLDPRNLPDSIGLPIIAMTDCARISFDYEDLVLTSDEACVKIIREWTVLDWCQYNANQSTGRFVYNQIIKLHDTQDPSITQGCGSIPVTDPLDDNCQVQLDIRAAATDDCTPDDEIRWSYLLRNTETNQESSGFGNDLSGLYDIGNYRITWTATDNCDNEVSCTQTLTVEDTKAPTPYCLGDIVTVLNQNTKSVEIWASDFVTGSADNCGPKENSVTIAFSEDRSDTNILIDCSDFTSEEYEQSVRVYAIDRAGNFTYCEARLIVQDNHDLCEIPTQGGGGDTIVCNVVGGELLTIETDTTEVTVCVVDTISDAVIVKVWEEVGDNSTYILTDADGNILRVTNELRFEFEGTGAGTNFIYHVSSIGDVAGLEVGSNIADLDGCFELSNELRVNKIDGDCNTTQEEGRSAIIAGHIYTVDNQMVDGVEVNAYSDESAYHQSLDTDQQGNFAFPELEMYKDYMVEATKIDNHLNGVSTLDLVLIQRHILGLKLLDSPFKVIAADANNSASISASDLVLIRKLILGVVEEFPNNDAWRFVEHSQEFTNEYNPFPFREQIEYYDLQSNEMSADFVAVKVGDVNNTVRVNNLTQTEVRSTNKKLVTKAAKIQGNIFMIPVHVEESSTIAGVQFTLDLGRSFTYKGVSGKQLKITEGNIGQISDTEITLSWNTDSDDLSIDADEPLFYLIVESNDPAKSKVEEIQMNSTITSAELYESTQEAYGLELVHEFSSDIVTVEGEFKLYQNVPNPFANETTISFYLPKREQVTMRLIDITGKVVLSQTATYNKGENQIIVNSKEINTQGVLYYQLETESNIANMKMIVLK